MFRPNTFEQQSIFDSYTGLTAREQKFLDNSWAKIFHDQIFPNIDEKPFSVLYSDKGSRPNTPVNVTVGALIIKEMFQKTDDEMLEDILLDPRVQYALHTTNFVEQPMSDKTLQRFRRKLAEYEQETGIDLMHGCITSLSAEIESLMGISGKVKRMDSMMIAANIKKLSRVELIYTCIQGVVQEYQRADLPLPEGMEHYLKPSDFNVTFYHADKEKKEENLTQILLDATCLLQNPPADVAETKAFALLRRCIDEQTIEEESALRLKTKEDGNMDSGILQNPSDPDATFRKKAGKEHQGYVVNVVESCGENGTIVTDYQFEPNNHSDSSFLKDYLDGMEKAPETVKLVADGAYGGLENEKLAEEKNIDLCTTALNGRDTEEIHGDFTWNEDNSAVLSCPAGHAPKKCLTSGNGQVRLSFDRDQCANCPHQAQCKAKIHKKVANVTTSPAAFNRARQKKYMKTEEFKNLQRLRNGVETVPSHLRNTYHADRMPVRGLERSRTVFGCKVGALNVRKLIGFLHSRDNYAQNPILAGC